MISIIRFRCYLELICQIDWVINNYGCHFLLLTPALYLPKGLYFLFPGAIRCYCNTAECEAQGHTCISHTEKCYSKLYTVYNTQQNETDSPPSDEHGCIDLALNPSHGSICDGTGDVVRQMKTLEPLIMCCSDNMCNYRENQDIQVDIIDETAVSAGKLTTLLYLRFCCIDTIMYSRSKSRNCRGRGNCSIFLSTTSTRPNLCLPQPSNPFFDGFNLHNANATLNRLCFT